MQIAELGHTSHLLIWPSNGQRTSLKNEVFSFAYRYHSIPQPSSLLVLFPTSISPYHNTFSSSVSYSSSCFSLFPIHQHFIHSLLFVILIFLLFLILSLVLYLFVCIPSSFSPLFLLIVTSLFFPSLLLIQFFPLYFPLMRFLFCLFLLFFPIFFKGSFIHT
jgi:hypothetical protein